MYLIPLIASLVVLALMLLLIICIRGKWRDRKRREEAILEGHTPLKKKRNAPITIDGRKYYNQTSHDSTSSQSSSSTQSTELRTFDYNRASLLDSTSTCSTPPVLSPPMSPKDEGAKDEWRRFRVHRNSTQIEIIV